MVFDYLSKLTEPLGSMPNKFTLGMGDLIRKARLEAKLSQADLARYINRRQASLSDMENGKMQPDAETLMDLSVVLAKPLTYFFPSPYGDELRTDKIDDVEKELLLLARRLPKEDLKRLIALAKALADVQP